jgi:hypothetical protein
MESAVFAALFASSLVAGVVVLALRGAARPAPPRVVVHRGRLRLPVRTFERAVVVAVVAGAGAAVPLLGAARAPVHVTVGAVAVAVAVAWVARRGAFLSPRSDDDGAGVGAGEPRP